MRLRGGSLAFQFTHGFGPWVKLDCVEINCKDVNFLELTNNCI